MNIDISGFSPSVTAILQTRSHELLPHISRLREVIEVGDYSMPEASVNVPFDDDIVARVDALVEHLSSPQLRYIFLVGIGGSNLGAEAVYQALYRARDMLPHSDPRLISLDTNNNTWLLGIMNLITTITDPNEFVVLCVSKSGNTTETLANTEILLDALEKQCHGPMPERVVVISDENSPFLEVAKMRGIHTCSMPPKVGGRYSVFTAVGLLPLAFCGVNIREFVAGAKAVMSQASHPDCMLNPMGQIALLSVEAYRTNQIVHNFFVFNSELETLGKWWRQLVGESCGKMSIERKELVGIVPTVSIGSTDLHSVGQLYLGGPSHTFTLFVSSDSDVSISVPQQRVFPELVPMISGKSVGQIMQAILLGTQAAYRDKERPFVSIELPAIRPYELGRLMQAMMVITILTGRLLDVNPFDQPDVESYKTRTKTLLENS